MTERMVRRAGMATVLAAAVLGLGSAPAGAAPSKIVYACAPNLCAVDPATGVSSPITTDGTDALPYRDPSLSADGSRLAARRGGDVLVGAYGADLTERWNGSQGLTDVALSPDGTAVAESHSYVQNVNRVRCYPFAGCQLELVLEDFSGTSYSVGVSAEGNTKGFSGGGGVGFLGAGTLLTSWYTLDGDVHRVCAIATPATPADPPCGVTIEQVGAPLSWPDGARDGTLIAAARGPLQEGGSTVVNVYDAATGALLREVATGTAPAFSPDGRLLAFETPEQQIAVVPAAGGTPRTLVAGTAPTWSAGAGPGARLAATTARLRKGRIRLALRCEGSARCTGAVRITKGRTTIGSGSYRVAAGRSARVAVKTTKRGRKAIAKRGKHTLRVRIAPRGAAATTTKLVLRR